MQYVSKQGQSIYDVCLQTYGTLQYLLKLITDNRLNSIGQSFQNKNFYFDENLVVDNLRFNGVKSGKLNYVTAANFIGLTTDDGIQITTDNGINIIID